MWPARKKTYKMVRKKGSNRAPFSVLQASRRPVVHKLKVKPLLTQKSWGAYVENQEEIRLESCKHLLRRHAEQKLPNIVFTDEKVYTVSTFVNHESRVYFSDNTYMNCEPYTRLMIWAGFTADGRAPLVFLPDDSKLDVENYQESVLEGCLKPWTKKHFKDQPYTVQHDSAPVHRSAEIQTWLSQNASGFISAQEWPPYSADLNPMTSYVWELLEKRVVTEQYNTVAEVKTAFIREWERIPQTLLQSAATTFVKQLEIIVNEGRGIE